MVEVDEITAAREERPENTKRVSKIRNMLLVYA